MGSVLNSSSYNKNKERKDSMGFNELNDGTLLYH